MRAINRYVNHSVNTARMMAANDSKCIVKKVTFWYVFKDAATRRQSLLDRPSSVVAMRRGGSWLSRAVQSSTTLSYKLLICSCCICIHRLITNPVLSISHLPAQQCTTASIHVRVTHVHMRTINSTATFCFVLGSKQVSVWWLRKVDWNALDT